MRHEEGGRGAPGQGHPRGRHREKYTPPALSGAIAGDIRTVLSALTPAETRALIAWFGSESKTMAAKSLNVTVHTIGPLTRRARDHYDQVGRPATTKTELAGRMMQDGLINGDQRPLRVRRDSRSAGQTGWALIEYGSPEHGWAFLGLTFAFVNGRWLVIAGQNTPLPPVEND
jgi:hypothetical protein